jgi:hypothetical protein
MKDKWLKMEEKMKAKITRLILSNGKLAVIEFDDGYKLPMWNKIGTKIEVGMSVNVSEIFLDEIEEEYVELVSL